MLEIALFRGVGNNRSLWNAKQDVSISTLIFLNALYLWVFDRNTNQAPSAASLLPDPQTHVDAVSGGEISSMQVKVTGGRKVRFLFTIWLLEDKIQTLKHKSHALYVTVNHSF